MRTRMNAFSAAGAALLAASLGATSSSPAAAAATTWTIKPGGAISAKAGKTTLTDPTTGTSITCTSSRMSGSLKSGSGLSGSDIGSLSKGSFSDCSDPPGPRFTIKLLDLPWHINFTSYSNGVIQGTISHIEAKVTATGCSMVIDGTAGGASDGMVRFTYNVSTGKLMILKTGGNLHIYDVSGCFGVVVNGDAATFTATYTITPHQVISP